MKARQKPKRTYDPAGSWLYIAVFGIMALGIIGIFISSRIQVRNEQKQADWPEIRGRPTGTRIIKEPPTKAIPTGMYIGQCSVEYVVAEKRYIVWAASGYLDPDVKWIADRMHECPVSRYAVHYNPLNPGEATATRLDGPP